MATWLHFELKLTLVIGILCYVYICYASPKSR